jgi:hypothetical protein
VAAPEGLSAARAAGLAAAALAFVAAAPLPRDAADAAGVWELSLENANRKCPLTLSLDPGIVGRQLRFPVGCRRALPLVAMAAGWLVEGGAVRLVGADGRPLLGFAPAEGSDVLRARTEAGESYTLERKEDLRLGRPAPPPPVEPVAGAPQPTAVDPERAPVPADVPGTYVVDRYTERDVCRIDLGRLALSAPGRYQARLAEGCRDAGLSLFDPVSWRYEAGRLTITSRRGHEVTLVSERDGHWRRDPEVGATLVLRKAP